tara:strand:+ start:2573 stop:2863 length:291 start_codon:yes stop_codon:yes gene_type:complete
MTEKKQSRDMGVGPSTKKLKSMLKILSEHGVSRYKDSEFEIELAIGFQAEPIVEKSESFSFSNYDEEASNDDKKSLEVRDGLGYTEEDYLWRSAET